jgi:hypothetical protein
VPFLLWFSGGGNSSSPAVFKATYLKSNTYDGGVIELPSEVSDVLESDPRGDGFRFQRRSMSTESIYRDKRFRKLRRRFTRCRCLWNGDSATGLLSW